MSLLRLRSVLFCPAVRPEFVLKGSAAGADTIVIDLEDAVSASRKHEARELARASVEAHIASGSRAHVFVRVNAPTTTDFERDLASISPHATGIVIPKVEAAADVARALAALSAGTSIIAGVESARGIHEVGEIAQAGVSALYFGAEDYCADIGGERTSAGLEVLYARSRVVLAARLHGVTPIDQAVIDIRDDDHFRRDVEAGRQLGFAGKLCLHPAQVAIANEAFTPTADAIAHARALLAAYETGLHEGRGVTEFEGQMIDEAVCRRARFVLELANADEQPRRGTPA